jgi:predicted dehydrogenase
MLKSNNINRRRFLKKATGAVVGAAAFPYVVPSSSLGKAGNIAASERIVTGCIGVGSEGIKNMQFLMNHSDCRVVAVCDVWPMQREKARNIVNQFYGNNDCAVYTDFRELLARDDIDAISNSTPDHWHCLISIAAAKAGKHVHHEKAMGLTLEEDIAVREAVRRYGVVFQFGTEQRSFRNQRFACELVRNGRIGELHTIKVGSPKSLTCPNQKPEPIPERFDYDMWLGPSPLAPYSWQRCRPWTKEGYSMWYHISDYCQGFVAGWGIHYIDIAQWGNGSDDTGPIEAEGSGVFPEDGLTDCATSWTVKMKYANGVTLIYGSDDRIKNGVTFEGSEGEIYVRYNSSVEAYPASIAKSVIGPNEIHLYESPEHMRNFLDCIKTGKQTAAPVEQAVRTDTVCHLANIATRLEHKLHWDPVKEQFVNDDQANRMLSRSMRSPWYL